MFLDNKSEFSFNYPKNNDKFLIEIPNIIQQWQNNDKSNKNQFNRPNFSYENQIFLEPEYLDDQKKKLKTEILQLRNEIKPLSDQFRELKSKTEIPNEAGDEYLQKDISSDLADLHLDLDQLKSNLGKLRRFYTESTQKRLESDINYQKNQLNIFYSEVNNFKEILNQRKEELNKILSSPLASSIIEQRDQIHELILKRDSLLELENQLLERHKSQFDDTPLFMKANNQINQLKRKIQLLDHQKISLKIDLRRKKNDYDEEIKRLNNLIEQKTNKKTKIGRASCRERVSDPV